LTSSRPEIADLLEIVNRSLADAGVPGHSVDGRFTAAYNAVLQLATVVLRASGFRAAGGARHWITFQVLPELVGERQTERAEYFDACRTKRHHAAYDAAGRISEAEIQELLEEARAFRTAVFEWLRREHPELSNR
jgi:hypothetical protein